MQSSPTLSTAAGVEPSAAAKLWRTTAEFLIRRRIIISAILFSLLIVEDVLSGDKPHDLANLRDPITLAGGFLVIAGLALRSWAAGVLHKDKELSTRGPYRLIRNPLYVGSFLMMFGFCALIDDPTNLLLMIGPVLVLYVVKIRQEERFLAAQFPAQWAGYAQSTPRLIPRFRRVDLSADWRFAQWLKSREYQALFATVAALAAIKLWQVL